MVTDFLETTRPFLTPGASVTSLAAGTRRLEIPPGPKRQYRLAQLDDYHFQPRAAFPWFPPLKLCLRARVSSPQILGTWGFGFWNDPFSLSLGFGGGKRRLPALPNAAWFFFASDPNHLALQDNLPGKGFLAATFRSPRWPPLVLGAALPALPLLAIPPLSRLARRIVRKIVSQDATLLNVNVAQWHQYELSWSSEDVTYKVDDEIYYETHLSPLEPLGFVLWIDNQYAAWTAQGKLAYGTLKAEKAAWLEVQDVIIQRF